MTTKLRDVEVAGDLDFPNRTIKLKLYSKRLLENGDQRVDIVTLDLEEKAARKVHEIIGKQLKRLDGGN